MYVYILPPPPHPQGGAHVLPRHVQEGAVSSLYQILDMCKKVQSVNPNTTRARSCTVHYLAVHLYVCMYTTSSTCARSCTIYLSICRYVLHAYMYIERVRVRDMYI